jgi:hypothetical protein
MKPLFLYVHERQDSYRSFDPAARFLAPPDDLFIKVVS